MVRLEPKAASERRNYTFDWASYLGGTDTITTSVVLVEGVTLVADSNNNTSATVEVSGGTDGTVAKIINTITTADGHIETETFILPIETGEPVSVAEAKEQLKIFHSSEDARIASYIKTAREWVEDESGRILIRRQIVDPARCSFGRWIDLNYRPIISVDEVSYTDSDGTVALYADFVVSNSRGRVYPALNGAWPTLATNGEVMVTYTAGYAQGEAPERLIEAIHVLVTGMFENRGSIPEETANTARWLCGQLRPVIV